MTKLDIFEYDINKLLRRMKKKHIRPIMCPPHPNLNGIPVMVNSKGDHSLPVAPENGLPPIDSNASGSFGFGDGAAFSGSLGDAGGGSISMAESVFGSSEHDVKYIINSLIIPHLNEKLYIDFAKKILKDEYFKENFDEKSIIQYLKGNDTEENIYEVLLDDFNVPIFVSCFINKLTDDILEKGTIEKENSKVRFLADLCSAYGTVSLGPNVMGNAFNRDLGRNLGFYDVVVNLLNNYKDSELSKEKTFLVYFLQSAKKSVNYFGDRTYESKRQLYYTVINILASEGNSHPTDEEIIKKSSELLCNSANTELVNAMKQKLEELGVDSVDVDELRTLVKKFYKERHIEYKGKTLFLKDFKDYYKTYNNNKPLDKTDLNIVRGYYLFNNSISLDASVNDGSSDDKQLTVQDTVSDSKQDPYFSFNKGPDPELITRLLGSLKNTDRTKEAILLDYLGFTKDGEKTYPLNELEIARKYNYTLTHAKNIIGDCVREIRSSGTNKS